MSVSKILKRVKETVSTSVWLLRRPLWEFKEGEENVTINGKIWNCFYAGRKFNEIVACKTKKGENVPNELGDLGMTSSQAGEGTIWFFMLLIVKWHRTEIP